jgi:hypothetical protein
VFRKLTTGGSDGKWQRLLSAHYIWFDVGGGGGDCVSHPPASCLYAGDARFGAIGDRVMSLLSSSWMRL